jgi:GTP pyrophosphokinase
VRSVTDIITSLTSYDKDADVALVEKAYLFAQAAHHGQFRASGEPYFSHPAEIAYNLTTLKLDMASVITALLHDTVEDTEATLEQITELFGAEIGALVDGVTKLNRLELKADSNAESEQAENFRKLVLAMSNDLRVLVVKLADRLHNMQTIHHIKKEEKRQRKARETLEIYAPLAERIGMSRLKEELQDLCFRVLHADARESIVNRLDFLRQEGLPEVERTEALLLDLLRSQGLNAQEVSGRQKAPYSIWRKMESKNISFEQLGDVIAFRIIVETVAECYQALGIIHNEYHTIPGRFKDYISTPKANGYQSIHTDIMGPNRQRIEVQIRTREMHNIAEYGVAAHWAYKQHEGDDAARDGKQYRWMRQLLEILEKTEDAEEFLEHTKLEMYHDQVFCFTPKGDIQALPRGATPVDFAFQVHSRVGFRCVGAKVNGRIVPLKTPLKNGDQVEIITSKTQTPSPAWERFVVTGKARSEIRKFIRTQQREEYVTLGQAILQKTFKKEGLDLHERAIEKVLDVLRLKTVEDVYAHVGEGMLGRNKVYEAVTGLPITPEKEKKYSSLPKLSTKSAANKHSLPIKGLLPGMAIHFAGCCHPIPGDKIVGIVTTGKGITIHTMDCAVLENYADSPERWIDVAWDATDAEESYIGRIRVTVAHEQGSIATLTNVIAQEKGNINNFKIINRTLDVFEILVDVEVKGDTHMNNIIANLRSKPLIYNVERYAG